jgi:hypothetical protein
MTAFNWLNSSFASEATLMVNLAVIAWNFVLIRRNRRLQRDLESDRAEVLAEFDHVRLLDRVLTGLCISACHRDNVPVWKAWGQTMGTLKVEISAVRKPF